MKYSTAVILVVTALVYALAASALMIIAVTQKLPRDDYMMIAIVCGPPVFMFPQLRQAMRIIEGKEKPKE